MKIRGVQVIAVCKSADLLLMVLDAVKPHTHRDILTRELESVGIRLNREPPRIYLKKKKTGGLSFNSTVPLTKLDEKLVQRILQEYKMHNADVLVKEDASVDDLIDVLEVRCASHDEVPMPHACSPFPACGLTLLACGCALRHTSAALPLSVCMQ